jgi:hypothetical protein
VNCLSDNSDVKATSPWVFLFFIYSLFHTDFCRFDVRYNNISVFIPSSESDSELRATSSTIAHVARLEETTSQCALTLCHAVSPVLRLPALPCVRLRLQYAPCLTDETPTAVTAPGLSSAPAEVGEMWGTWQVSLTGILTRSQSLVLNCTYQQIEEIFLRLRSILQFKANTLSYFIL